MRPFASFPGIRPGSDDPSPSAQSCAVWGGVAGLLTGALILYLASNKMKPPKKRGVIAATTSIGVGLGLIFGIILDDQRVTSRYLKNLPVPPADLGPDTGPPDNDSSSRGENDPGNDDSDDSEEVGGCFVAGTPVLLADRSQVPIETVKLGDALLAQDPASRELIPQPATTLFTHNVQSTLLLALSDGTTIHTTRQHRFYVPGDGFVAAHALRLGSTLVTHDAKHLTVVDTTPFPSNAVVYNLEIANAHTYFVGQAGVWVHNVKDSEDTDEP